MREEILEYLYERNTGQYDEINELLLSLPDSKNLRATAELLDKLEKSQAIHLSGEWSKIGLQGFDLNNIKILAKIRPDGISEIKNYLKSKKQDDIIETQAESIITTNDNLRTTNDSTRKLNDLLTTTNKLTVVIAAITAIFIGMQFFKDDAPNQQRLNKLLEQNTKLLDSLLQTQKRLDSSLEIIVKKFSEQKKK